MGLVILPYLIGALAIVIHSVITILGHYRDGALHTMDLIFGILLSAIIFGLIVLSYKLKEKSYALSPIFRFPSYMIYVPFLMISLVNRLFTFDINHVYNSVLISIIVSALIMIVFNGYVFNIIDKVGRKKYY